MVYGDRRGKGGKPGKPRHGGAKPPGKRTPPPDNTGAETVFIKKLKESAAPVSVKLSTGETHHGRIEYYDNDMIKLTRPEGPHLFIRKSDIRYMTEG
ncbi:MAG: Sm ribonucleo-like protein [bacterium]|nr:Sm ribonucleo-like protein [bacterium]